MPFTLFCNSKPELEVVGTHGRKHCSLCFTISTVCKHTCEKFIRNTQKNEDTNHAARMRSIEYVNKKITSYRIDTYFASYIPSDLSKTTSTGISKLMKVEILWKWNHVSQMKTYRQQQCSLCIKEHILILKKWKYSYKTIISNHKIYIMYRDNSRVHRCI